jgi:dihydrofolate reductase
VTLDYARIWQGADKVVYSRSLPEVMTPRTRIERTFDPGAIQRLKATAERDVSVGGPEVAAEALRAGLVDELRLFLVPVVVGRGKPALATDLKLHLALEDERRFAGGTVYLHYRVL